MTYFMLARTCSLHKLVLATKKKLVAKQESW
jgi:hypothetical protein